MQIQILPKAAKDLKALAPPDRARVVSKIEQYAADPASLVNNVKALQGSDLFRLRVGDYRILFTVNEDGTVSVLLVHRVRHRREAYD